MGDTPIRAPSISERVATQAFAAEPRQPLADARGSDWRPHRSTSVSRTPVKAEFHKAGPTGPLSRNHTAAGPQSPSHPQPPESPSQPQPPESPSHPQP